MLRSTVLHSLLNGIIQSYDADDTVLEIPINQKRTTRFMGYLEVSIEMLPLFKVRCLSVKIWPQGREVSYDRIEEWLMFHFQNYLDD